MRDIRQIIADNGWDNTPALDTHNLTGRALPEGVEQAWAPLDGEDVMDEFGADWLANHEARNGPWEDEDFASLDDVIDCE